MVVEAEVGVAAAACCQLRAEAALAPWQSRRKLGYRIQWNHVNLCDAMMNRCESCSACFVQHVQHGSTTTSSTSDCDELRCTSVNRWVSGSTGQCAQEHSSLPEKLKGSATLPSCGHLHISIATSSFMTCPPWSASWIRDESC